MKDIEIIKFIKTEYAHRHSAVDYRYDLFTASSPSAEEKIIRGIIEIGYVEENPLIFTDDDNSVFRADIGDIFILLPGSHYRVSTENKGLHRHITTESVIECYLENITGKAHTVRMPMIIKNDERSERIRSTIRQITKHHSTVSADMYYTHCADFYSLISAISSYLNEAPVSPSAILYCKKAKQYILDNLTEQIHVGDIADSIGISKNYLINIFSDCEKMPIREYINRLKLRHISELMSRFGYGIREAGEYVGFTNPNYVSRIFRKYYGVPITEYLRNMRNV